MPNKIIAASALAIFASVVTAGMILLQLNSLNGRGSAQAEALELSNQRVWACEWIDQSGWAEAAIVVLNTGETDAVIRKIMVRGIECARNNVYYWQTDTGPISDELEPTLTELTGSSFNISIDGVERAFQRATERLATKSRWTMILYIRDPINLTSYDGDGRIVMSIFTDNDLYSAEALLEGSRTFTFRQTEELSFTGYTWDSTSPYTWIQLTVKNTGSAETTLVGIKINAEDAGSWGYSSYLLVAGDSVTLNVTRAGSAAYTSGFKYEFTVLTAKGNTFGPYIRPAP